MAVQAQYPPTSAMFAAAAPAASGSSMEEDDEAFLDQLLSLRDAVLAGSHPSIKLPQAAIDSLKSSLSAANNAAAVTANRQLHQSSNFPMSSATGLNPIFLQKSDSLVRAEGQLKRQRIERELQTAKERESTADGTTHIDVDSVLLHAWQRVNPVSGLKTPVKAAGEADTSFDENDYYSSQVQSDWSSDGQVHADSDQNVGAPLKTGAMHATHSTAAPSFGHPRPVHPGKAAISGPQSQGYMYGQNRDGSEEEGEIDEDEDDYVPPDADAFDGMREDHQNMLEMQQANEADDEDDSEYEPGDITQDSAAATPHYNPHQKDSVPIIRNHLTHLIAPQPNRVSPLTTANIQGGRIDLELVNGRPEVRPKPHQASRASTMSPPQGAPAPVLSKKAASKKRKREEAMMAASAPPTKGKKRNRSNAEFNNKLGNKHGDHPAQPNVGPPFAAYAQSRATQHAQYAASRYEYNPPSTPARIVSSSMAYPQAQRDTADLRRVASLHQARAASPDFAQPVAPYHPQASRYAQEDFRVAPSHQVHVQTPPRAEPQRIVIDQFGNRYVAADPMPPPAPIIATPIERHPGQDGYYERAPTRMQSVYAAPPAYDHGDSRMPPPTVHPRQDYQPSREQRIEYVTPNGQYEGQSQRYDMGPPSTRERLSPVFTPPHRVYSVRPQEPAPAPEYVRQPSVAPSQYFRGQPPARALSVMPASEYGHAPVQQQPAYSYPAPVKYVDQYGNPVHFA